MMTEENKRILNLLIDFLQKNNAYNKYIINLREQNENPKATIRKLATANQCMFLIDGAFVWTKTPQGTVYWVNLDTSWRNFARKHKIR